MTWNPLKRNYLNQRPTSAHPCLTVAEDRELDITVQRLMNIENVVRNLIKEMKKFVETKISIDKGDQRLTSDLRQCPLVNRNDKFRILVEEYLSVTSQNGLTLQDTIMLFQKTFIEPLKRLREELIYIKDMLCKREDLVNVWKNSYSNLKKLQEKREKTASHIVKLEKEKKTEEFLAKQLKICHSQLISELPVFLEKRLDYLKPTIQAFIAIQLESYGNSTKTFTQLMPNSNYSSSPSSVVDEEHNQTVNAHLNLIKNLTIIKND